MEETELEQRKFGTTSLNIPLFNIKIRSSRLLHRLRPNEQRKKPSASLSGNRIHYKYVLSLCTRNIDSITMMILITTRCILFVLEKKNNFEGESLNFFCEHKIFYKGQRKGVKLYLSVDYYFLAVKRTDGPTEYPSGVIFRSTEHEQAFAN